MSAQRRMCATAAGALSETVATISLRTDKMLSMFQLRNKKGSATGPTLFRAGTVPEMVSVRSLILCVMVIIK